MNSFISRSADAFSYDDGITFVLKGNRLEIVEHDPLARAKWQRDGERLERLHQYWLYRAVDAFIDWASLAARLRKGEACLHPELFERPIIKMGRYLFQLPWVVGLQNNSTAAINNLRRIGSRRSEARDETRRIEKRLATLFEERGFRVQVSYLPEPTADGNPGEVDLVCARDGQVLVIELKSTFLRRSQKDAWLHGANTLRKAGLQLGRKVTAVGTALATDADFSSKLGLDAAALPPTIHGWIVDTSIERDHEHFNGFLKLSLEELQIALHDDSHLLNGPGGSGGAPSTDPCPIDSAGLNRPSTLYPAGFSFAHFIEVIESEMVWNDSLNTR